jgi:hypothetical protein
MTVGGSILQASIKGRIFAATADADGTRKLGGFTADHQANGDATGRIILTRTGWSFEGLVLSIDDTRGDQEFLQEVVEGKKPVDITLTFASDITYGGRGTITGDIAVSSQSSTCSVNLAGPGKLEKQ